MALNFIALWLKKVRAKRLYQKVLTHIFFGYCHDNFL